MTRTTDDRQAQARAQAQTAITDILLKLPWWGRTATGLAEAVAAGFVVAEVADKARTPAEPAPAPRVPQRRDFGPWIRALSLSPTYADHASATYARDQFPQPSAVWAPPRSREAAPLDHLVGAVVYSEEASGTFSFQAGNGAALVEEDVPFGPGATVYTALRDHPNITVNSSVQATVNVANGDPGGIVVDALLASRLDTAGIEHQATLELLRRAREVTQGSGPGLDALREALNPFAAIIGVLERRAKLDRVAAAAWKMLDDEVEHHSG